MTRITALALTSAVFLTIAGGCSAKRESAQTAVSQTVSTGAVQSAGAASGPPPPTISREDLNPRMSRHQQDEILRRKNSD